MKIIKLSQNKETLVDDEDYEFLNQWKWYYKQGYAVRTERYGPRKEEKSYTFRMHRALMNPSNVEEIDHINGNRLDNRKVNLRIVNDLENSYNRTKKINSNNHFKGVVFNKKLAKFIARLQYNGVRLYLGLFENEIDAAKAYNEAAIKYHGKFAKLNEV